MAEFYVPKNKDELAAQVAVLLNQHNRLTKVHSQFTINGSPAKYYIELAQFVDGGAFISKVVGCVGLTQESPTLTRLHHLSVDVLFRNKGLAKNLIKSALKYCQTEFIYMKVRDDNKACHRAAFHYDFQPSNVEARNGYNLVTLSRRV